MTNISIDPMHENTNEDYLHLQEVSVITSTLITHTLHSIASAFLMLHSVITSNSAIYHTIARCAFMILHSISTGTYTVLHTIARCSSMILHYIIAGTSAILHSIAPCASMI